MPQVEWGFVGKPSVTPCTTPSSRVVRLTFVTCALLATTMELVPIDSRLVYLTPLLVALFVRTPNISDGGDQRLIPTVASA